MGLLHLKEMLASESVVSLFCQTFTQTEVISLSCKAQNVRN